MKPNNLKIIRTKNGVTLWGLATRSGISTTTLCAVEKHGYFPTEERRSRIAAALEVSVLDIWPTANAEVATA